MPDGTGGGLGGRGSFDFTNASTAGDTFDDPALAMPGAGRDTTAGLVSYASRLILIRWRGEMLSDVMLPPHPPQPSVIDGSSPVVSPIDPCVVGVLTTIRYAGFLRPNSRMISSLREWIDMVCPMPP